MVRKLNPDRKLRFLTSALKLFVAQGVQNTSTAEIARDAGSAAGTLFLYFPTKLDLVNALVLEIGRQQAEAITSLLTPSLSARESFFTIWDGSLRWFLEHVDAYLYIRQVRDSGMISEAVVQESNKYFAYYYEAIQKGLQEGGIKPYPVEIIGEFLYQDLVAMMNRLRAQPDPSKQEETIRMGFDIFWDGIKR
jgi:AcrR family transcriptional regulator